METILLATSPIVISLLVAGIKRLRASQVLTKGKRMVFFRLVVAVLSYSAVVGAAIASGAEVDPVATETFVNSIMMMLTTTGLYFLGKKK